MKKNCYSTYLLIDYNKSLISSITDFLLELNDFVHTLLNEIALGLDHLLSLFSCVVEKP